MSRSKDQIRLAGDAAPEGDGVGEDAAARLVGVHDRLPQPGRGRRRAHQVPRRALLRRRLHRERPPRLAVVHQHQVRQRPALFTSLT